MPQADRDYLAAYVRAQPSRAKDESLEDYLKRVKVDPGAPGKQETEPPAPPQQVTQNNRHVAEFNRQQAKAAAEAKLAAEQEARRQEAKNADLIHKGFYASGILPNAAADRVERVRAWVANLPTPGGNGAMLLILLGFVAFIVPVSGAYTRAQLFWLSLLDRTSLSEQKGSEPITSRPTGQPAEAITGRPAGQPVEPVGFTPQAIPFTLPLPGASTPQLPSTLS
jgi:hypothetical protein